MLNNSEKGQGFFEFALIVLLIAIVVTATLLLLGPNISNWIDLVRVVLGGGG
jgi:Flp pilus assembly pilin Flp